MEERNAEQDKKAVEKKEKAKKIAEGLEEKNAVKDIKPEEKIEKAKKTAEEK